MMQSITPIARLWKLVQEEKGDITAIYFFAVAGGLIQLSIPLGIQTIIGFVQAGALSASLVLLISFLVFGVGLTGALQVAQMKVIEKIQQRIFTRYSFAFASHIPRLDLKAIDAFYLPELVNRFFDTTSLQKSISKLLLDLPTAMIQILFGLTLLSFYHPFFILFGILLLLLLWLILRLTGNKGLDSSLTESRFKYGVAGWLQEMARLIKSFKFSSHAGLHLQKADERTIGYLQARTKHFGVLLLQYKALLFFKVIITASILIVGVALLLNGNINIGQFVAAEIIVITIISAVEKIIINLDSVYDALTAIEKVSKVIDKPTEVGGSYRLMGKTGIAIAAKELSFSYKAEKSILHNLSFSVSAGSKVAITGKDGSGKSTLLKLLAGVYKDFEGALLINNIPLANYDLMSLRENMGILFQHENIFGGTLLENITMGREGIDENYIDELVDKVGFRPFFTSLPLGFDTELDATGKRLPRNAIQKILLLRALAGKPKLILMEEPWQGIEDDYRESIQQLLLNLNETTVVVTCGDPHFYSKCNQTIHLPNQ